jgi:hypothetical protein
MVKVAEQRDFSSVVYLLVQQDGHDLARGRAAAEVARPGFEQVSVARRRQPGCHGSATVLSVRQDLVRRPVHRKVRKVAQTWPEGVLHIDLVVADQVGKPPTNARHWMGGGGWKS